MSWCRSKLYGMRMAFMNDFGCFHTLEGWLPIIHMIQDLVGLSKYMIQCVYGLFLNDKLNNLIAKSSIVAQESMFFRYGVNVLVEENNAWIA